MIIQTGTKANLKKRIDLYKNRTREIEKHLRKKPYEWGKFQVEFTREVNNVFANLMDFEKNCIEKNEENKLYKLKRIFVSKIRKPFERGSYIPWVITKPYGYAGDFKYINDIYENNPPTLGFDRLFDNYTMMSSISIAVRNRKDDFKRMIINYVQKKRKKNIRIMNLASGPCREIIEMKTEHPGLFKNVTFDCYDSDKYSLDFAKKRLKGFKNINFINENAARIAFRKNIRLLINQRYDVIYSTGLFDYFEDKIALRLIGNLKKLLTRNGALMISDVRDKYSNPSLYFMEWVGDWPLVYRTDENFRKLFIEAGFTMKQLEIDYEQQGILQYIRAINK